MKQRNRVKRLQLFLYNTGRMCPSKGWSRTKQGYPGEYYRFSSRVNGFVTKDWLLKIHLCCKQCNGFGTVYAGTQESGYSNYIDCPHCKGSMWSRKGYRIN